MVNQLVKDGLLKKRLSIILTDDNIINKTIDEAKKDIFYHLSFDDYNHCTVHYDEVENLLEKIVKWFGESS